MSRPIIGITPALRDDEQCLLINQKYMDAVLRAGGAPILLPLTDDTTALETYLSICQGFLFSGGADVDPTCYGDGQLPDCGTITPTRDRMELKLAQMLIDRPEKAVLGVCRGIQVLNVALGGDLYQDLPTQYPHTPLAHRQHQLAHYPSHDVVVTMSSLLDMIVHASKIRVNSLHHQAIRRIGKGFVPCAVATDGVIEAAALEGHPFFLGVQWHPEQLFQTDDASLALFQAFVEACQGQALA